jgi:hypothetical protein
MRFHAEIPAAEVDDALEKGLLTPEAAELVPKLHKLVVRAFYHQMLGAGLLLLRPAVTAAVMGVMMLSAAVAVQVATRTLPSPVASQFCACSTELLCRRSPSAASTTAGRHRQRRKVRGSKSDPRLPCSRMRTCLPACVRG